MGKRTHSSTGSTYYQCDWTAHPLDRPTCQFPVWKLVSEDGEGKEEKLTKVGSFLNNECVMAKAYKMFRDGDLDEAGLDRVLGHLEERTGVSMQVPEEALLDIDPKVLIHFGGTYSLGHFKQRCEDMTREEMVTAILIPDDKSMPVREVFVGTEEAELIDGICDHLGRSKDADDNLRISHVDGRTRMNRERKYEMYHAKNSSAAVKNQRATHSCCAPTCSAPPSSCSRPPSTAAGPRACARTRWPSTTPSSLARRRPQRPRAATPGRSHSPTRSSRR